MGTNHVNKADVIFGSILDELAMSLIEQAKEKLEQIELNEGQSSFIEQKRNKLAALEFNYNAFKKEHKIMDMIYEEYGELINEILYGSKEESKEKVKTIRQEKIRWAY